MLVSEKLSKEFNLNLKNVENVISLIDEGNTIPFIARYRKEMTGGMEDVTLRELDLRLKYLRNLEERKEEVTRLIGEQEKLTEELSQEILAAETLQTLEDIYRPFKPKKRTRGKIAQELGLSPLADLIESKDSDEKILEEKAKELIEEKELTISVEDAIKGAEDILAENISDSALIRDISKKYLKRTASIKSEKGKEPNQIYDMYFEYEESIKNIPNHRVLAINRGEKENSLKISLVANKEAVEDLIYYRYFGENANLEDIRKRIVKDSLNRLLFSSLERELRRDLTERAEDEAINVFGLNLKPLLLQAPLKDKVVLAIDPAFRTGCKVAVVNEFGQVLEHTVIYPTEPHFKMKESEKELLRLISKHGVHVISIGNGTASRETEKFVADMIKNNNLDVKYIIVNEAGASIYSASPVGIEEFPDLDVTIRGAISIGRRLQDPLAELVKIEPKHIGVGQYQHDLNQSKLDETLKGVVEDCVNSVGVDLNTASISLLKYISGISSKVAQNILEYKDENGKFTSRKELKKVKGLGPKSFEQCAGFLRIAESENILDNTGVHPESYSIAEKLLDKDLNKINIKEEAIKLDVGEYTLKDIITELQKPGRDPREELQGPILKSDVLNLEDLEKGMVLTGTVRNVVDFGVFVDIGLKNDGLIHISKLSKKFINHPKEVAKVGDIIEVEVIDINKEKGRIGLAKKGV